MLVGCKKECDWLHKNLSETKWGQAISEGTLEEFRYETYHILRSEGYKESIANAFIKIAPILSESPLYFIPDKIADIMKGQVTFENLQEETPYNTVFNGLIEATRGFSENDINGVIYLLENNETMQSIVEEKSKKELYDEIVSEKYEYYRDKVIGKLEVMDKTLSPDDLKLDSIWEEFCFQIQNGESYDWALYEDLVRQLCEGVIDDEPENEVKLLWLETDAYLDYYYEGDENLSPTIESMVEDIGVKIYQEVYNAAENYAFADEALDEDEDAEKSITLCKDDK